MIDPQIIGTMAHQQRSPSSISHRRRPPLTRICDGRDQVRPLKTQMYVHSATLGSIGMVHNIGTRITHSNQHIINNTRACADS